MARTSSIVDEYWLQLADPISCSKVTSLVTKHSPGESQSAADRVNTTVRPPLCRDSSRSMSAGSRT